MMRTLHWFREDLRITDNTALYYATNQTDEGCLAVYIITPKTWLDHDMAPCRVDFILRGLHVLNEQLMRFNIPFLIQIVDSFFDIPDLLLTICHKYKIDAVYFNKQYEVNELERDHKVSSLLKLHGTAVYSYHDQTIIEPQLIRSKQNTAFTVYGFYRKAWVAYYQQNPVSLLPLPRQQSKPVSLITPTIFPSEIPGFDNSIKSDYWPSGEIAAKKRLDYFIANIISDYKINRDIPSIDGTSKLSPYLACGMISARQCLEAAVRFNQSQLASGNEGAMQWLDELIWREFYKMILVYFPRVSRHKPFKLNTDKLNWLNNEEYFSAWKRGNTGFPLVDAAMRQLQETGWMHNRLRMVAAMFFSKQLWLDWRLGERFFMQNLIDGDLAANNGGWQWCASTGNDAAPYFRIFNPITQSQRFDPEGRFIRQYCPELNHLDNTAIHQPYAKHDIFSTSLHYPQPIVDYKSTREEAIKQFKNLK
ncbi:MAG: deoxyribodipyrimidine photo-lyase [Legionellales bacterium]|nr:deoxyribodipyrimidine photo-lyase [Legionellales bacterium]